jgi:hypothetical protein
MAAAAMPIGPVTPTSGAGIGIPAQLGPALNKSAETNNPLSIKTRMVTAPSYQYETRRIAMNRGILLDAHQRHKQP